MAEAKTSEKTLVRNETGAAWVDAWSNQRVPKGGTLEIRDELVWNYVQSDIWSAANKKTQALADAQRDAIENPPSESADAATEEE